LKLWDKTARGHGGGESNDWRKKKNVGGFKEKKIGGILGKRPRGRMGKDTKIPAQNKGKRGALDGRDRE